MTTDYKVCNLLASPDEFNDYFISAVDYIVKNINPGAEVTDPDHIEVPSFANQHTMLNWTLVKPEDILKIVKHLNNSKTQDIYGMPSSILKVLVHAVVSPLAKVINGCLIEGYFPEELKLGRFQFSRRVML